ncbi:MAG: TetR/AcrR family transcriptional regulator [Alphaproteobacteria bacterium]
MKRKKTGKKSDKKNDLPRRDEFLAAALNRFARYGYAATSTRDICADVGIVHSAIYNYFPSKEAVLLAIESREMARMQGGLDALLDNCAGAPPLTRLALAIHYTLRVAVTGRAAWHLMAEMLRSLALRHRLDVVIRRDRYEGTIRALLEAAIAAGALPRQDVRLASLHIFGIAGGIAGWYRPDGEYSPDALVEHSMAACLRLIGAKPSAVAALQTNRSALASGPDSAAAEARGTRAKSNR